jgi:tagatose 1,6-diphosphate aldolase
MAFVFLDPGPLIDDDLRLIAPDARWIDEVRRSASHPLTVQREPAEANTTRQKLLDFLNAAPQGRQAGDAAAGRVPAYHFWMLADPAVGDPPIRIVGGMGVRIGLTPEIEMYSGNIGYHVYPVARGRRFAERACRLVLPLARRHGLDRIWITCNPDNIASKRTCERLGARFVDVVTIPKEHPFRPRGESAKCRYLIEFK